MIRGRHHLGDGAGERAVGTYLSWVDAGEMPGDDDLAAFFEPGTALPPRRAFFAARCRDLEDAEIVGVETNGLETSAWLHATDGRRWRMAVLVNGDETVRGLGVCRDVPPGVTIREARAEDGPGLAELCRQVPIVTPGRRTWLDYGDDYLEATAVGDRIVLVAEIDGRLAGLHGVAFRRTAIAGEHVEVAYLWHTRVDRAAQGSGVFSALNGLLVLRGAARTPFVHSIVAAGNDPILDRLPIERSWALHRRFHISCRDHAGRPSPGEHLPDAHDAASILRRTWADHLLSEPMDHDALADRLSRTPGYASDRIRAQGGAVLGVPARTTRARVERDDGHSSDVVQATAADSGCLPGAAADFMALLRSWCATLADEAVDELCIAATAGSELEAAIGALDYDVTDYQVNLALTPAQRGSAMAVYIDQVLM